MIIVYTGEDAPETYSKSLFLAGPSLRPDQEKMKSWREDALAYLEKHNYDGVVFSPEVKDGNWDTDFDYDDQIEWEHKNLNRADCILFWVNRDMTPDKKTGLPKLGGWTTNAEFGHYINRGCVVFGCPPDIEKRKNRYLQYYADFYNVPSAHTLEETLDASLEMLGEGAERSGSECDVPLFVWKTPSFQSWYLSQKRAGNSLNGAELLYTFRPNNKSFVFLWVLKVDVHIQAENRNKINEFVLARPDISSVCLWHGVSSESIFDTQVVIIKEFRSPANTNDAYIRELAGGSSFTPDQDPENTAIDEVHEETGLRLDADKLVALGGRQLCGTLSSHKSYLYSYQMDDDELEWIKSQKDVVHGKAEDTERTYVEVYTVQELLDEELSDWATLGQILATIAKE